MRPSKFTSLIMIKNISGMVNNSRRESFWWKRIKEEM